MDGIRVTDTQQDARTARQVIFERAMGWSEPEYGDMAQLYASNRARHQSRLYPFDSDLTRLDRATTDSLYPDGAVILDFGPLQGETT